MSNHDDEYWKDESNQLILAIAIALVVALLVLGIVFGTYDSGIDAY